MDVTDLIDVAGELLPRRVRRLIGLAFLALCLCSAGTAASIIVWYAHERAASIVHQLAPVLTPTARPRQP